MRREKQILQALAQMSSRGEKSVTVQKLVMEMYGKSSDEETRTLALEPFTAEVLRKLAGDGRVAFQMRGGKKQWYALDSVKRSRLAGIADKKGPSMVTVMVQEIRV